jgi:soluble lytic murein transglycosylase-like protein
MVQSLLIVCAAAVLMLVPMLLGGAEPARAEEGARTESQPRPAQMDPVTVAMPPKRSQLYRSILTREAKRSDLPTDLADAVVAVESGYNPGAVGKVGEVGLMQVRPQTAAMLGYNGTAAELMDPEVNISYGVRYLSKAWELAKGDLCLTLVKYRSGHGEDRTTALSASYCRRVQNRLASLGSPLAKLPLNFGTTAPNAAAVTTPPAVQQERRSPAIAEAVRRAWAEHVTRIRIIEAKTARIMAVP